MTPEDHLKAGDLAATLAALQDKVRKDPSDPRLRVFLFQLLCVLGDWKRAITQLKLSAEMDEGATMMARTYREAIICEVYREKVFAGDKTPMIFGEPEEWLALLIEAQKVLAQGKADKAAELRGRAFDLAPTSSGMANGQKFEWIADADMRLGPVLEVIVNGRYFWLPFTQIGGLEIEEPTDLRDAVWAAATLRLINGGGVAALIPTRDAGTCERGDAAAKLARATTWEDAGAETFVGVGQRSDPEGAAFLRREFGDIYSIHQVPTRPLSQGEDVLHLDCAFQPIGLGHALIYPAGLDTIPAAMRTRYDWIEVTRDEAAALATNVLSLAPDHLVARDHPACARVNAALRAAGYRVDELPFDAVPSTGGAFRCATLPLARG